MMLKTLAVALLCAATVSAAVAAGERAQDKRQFDSWETPESAELPDYLSFQHCFGIRGLATAVPQEGLAMAERLLEQDAAVPVDAATLRKLFPTGVPDGATLSEKAATAYDAKANETDQDVRGRQHATSAEHQASLRFEVAQDRYFAQYLRMTAPMRKAFLVRGVALNEGNGGFGITECGTAHTLWVGHSSLGRSWPKPVRKPLVIFLLGDPKNVYVTTSMAE